MEPHNPKPQIDERSFHHFARLPQEIRLYIWELALPCERFIKLRLGGPSPSGSLPHQALAAAEAENGDERRDRIIVYGRKIVPKLLHVCRESKSAALKFYRIRIPCGYISNSHGDERAEPEGSDMLYFNPEFDILKIRPSRRRESLVDFLCLLRDRDPKGIGLLNLAIDANDFGSDAWRHLDLRKLNSDARSIFLSTLSCLRQVLFMSVEAAGRMYLGLLQGIPGMEDYEMRRSLPIEGSVARFERLQSDPRNIEPELDKVFVGIINPRTLYLRWKLLLRTFGVRSRPDVQHRLLLACEPRPQTTQIVDQQSAREYILKEDKDWKDGLERHRKRMPKMNIQDGTPEYLQTVPKTAIGFWMFPIEALGPLPDLPSGEVGLADAQFETVSNRSIVDMRESRPELALLDLS